MWGQEGGGGGVWSLLSSAVHGVEQFKGFFIFKPRVAFCHICPHSSLWPLNWFVSSVGYLCVWLCCLLLMKVVFWYGLHGIH